MTDSSEDDAFEVEPLGGTSYFYMVVNGISASDPGRGHRN